MNSSDEQIPYQAAKLTSYMSGSKSNSHWADSDAMHLLCQSVGKITNCCRLEQRKLPGITALAGTAAKDFCVCNSLPYTIVFNNVYNLYILQIRVVTIGHYPSEFSALQQWIF